LDTQSDGGGVKLIPSYTLSDMSLPRTLDGLSGGYQEICLSLGTIVLSVSVVYIIPLFIVPVSIAFKCLPSS